MTKKIKRKKKKTTKKKKIIRKKKQSQSKKIRVTKKKKKEKKKKKIMKKDTFIEGIKKRLENEKARILSLLNHTKNEQGEFYSGVEDEVGSAETSFEREILFDLEDREKHLLEEIERALRKIKEGRFGICEVCGKSISKKRLKAIPYTRYCIKCASKM